MAAVTAYGPLRDRTMLTVLLHTGIRAAALCLLPLTAVTLEQRQGTLRVYGKRRKTRDVPLNATVGRSWPHIFRHCLRRSACSFPRANRATP